MKKIHIFSALAASVIILPLSIGVSAEEENTSSLPSDKETAFQVSNVLYQTNSAANNQTDNGYEINSDGTVQNTPIETKNLETKLISDAESDGLENSIPIDHVISNNDSVANESDEGSSEKDKDIIESPKTNNPEILDGTTPEDDPTKEETEDPDNKVDFTIDFSGLPSQMEVGKKTSGVIVVSADKSLNISFQKDIYIQVDSGHLLFNLNEVKETADNKTITYYVTLEPVTLGTSKLDIWDYYNHKDGILLASKEIEGINQVKPDPEPVEPIIFEDVSPNSWFASVVEQVSKLGIMTGTDSNHFSPYENMTRGMVATVLYRMEGSPNVSSESNFKDVPTNLWFSKPITWAKENRIINGYTGNKVGLFGPSDSITREQLSVMLMNYSAFKGINTSLRTGFNQFPDAKSVSSYASNAVDWMVSLDIISGVTVNGTKYLKPSQYASRAECAKMLLMIDKLCNDKEAFNDKMKKAEEYLTAYNEGSLSFFNYLATNHNNLDAQQAAEILADSQLKEYTHIGDSKDATSLENMSKALSYLEECNKIRLKENLNPLQVTSRLMAIAQKQVNYAAVTEKHAPNYYNVGENLSWQKEPYIGWYYEPKDIIENGGSASKFGNYENIINPNYEVTGFGVSENTKYNICNAQVFYFYGMGTDLETYIQIFNNYKTNLQNNINNSLKDLKIML